MATELLQACFDGTGYRARVYVKARPRARSRAVAQLSHQRFMLELNRVMAPACHQLLADQRAAILQGLARVKEKAAPFTLEMGDSLADWALLQKQGARKIKEPVLKVAVKSGNRALRLGGLQASFNVLDPKVLAWAEKHSAAMVKEVTDATRLAIRETITEGIKDGQLFGEIRQTIGQTAGLHSRQASALRKVGDELRAAGVTGDKLQRQMAWERTKRIRYRGQVIARTELAVADTEATLMAYNQEGVKEAQLLLGPNACEECLALQGRKFKHPQETAGILPVHPQCGCSWVATDYLPISQVAAAQQRQGATGLMGLTPPTPMPGPKHPKAPRPIKPKPLQPEPVAERVPPVKPKLPAELKLPAKPVPGAAKPVKVPKKPRIVKPKPAPAAVVTTEGGITPEIRHLQEFKPKSVKHLGGGVNSTFKMKNSVQGVWKPMSGTIVGNASSEVGTSIIDQELGFGRVPTTVLKHVGGEAGSFQVFVKNATDGEVWEASRGVRLRGVTHLTATQQVQAKQITIIDMVTGQIDRHSCNYIVKSGTGDLFAIDNGLAFTNQFHGLRNRFALVDSLGGIAWTDEEIAAVEGISKRWSSIAARLRAEAEFGEGQIRFVEGRIKELLSRMKRRGSSVDSTYRSMMGMTARV